MRDQTLRFLSNAISLAAVVAAFLAFLLVTLTMGGCSHLPGELTRAAAQGCSVMLDQAAAKCGDPITVECAAEAWNVPEKDARALLAAAERVQSE